MEDLPSMKQDALIGAGVCVLILVLWRLFSLRMTDQSTDKLVVEAVSFVI